MKIGIIGNMNNAYFSLARYLRDEGYDCELLILANEPAHFDPSCDTRSTDYKTYCRNVSWGEPSEFLKTDFRQVERDVAPYEFLIGNGAAPAYLARINRRLDVFVPYGYDLYSLPFLRLVHPVRQVAYTAVSFYQRRGIRRCSRVLFDRTNPALEKRIARLGFSHKRIVAPLPMLYHKDYLTGGGHTQNAAMRGLRQDNDFLVVQHGRQLWKSSADRWSFKGNQLLLVGYKQFLERTPSLRSKLVLFAYGDDVAESKKLVAKLGIELNVVWMPKMPRTELMDVVAESDLVVGELHHSWLSYGVVLEALSLGKPILHKRTDALYREDYPVLYPMLHADSSETVCEQLVAAASDRPRLSQMGEEGRNWFHAYCVSRPLAAITQAIEEKRAGTPCLKAS